MRVIIVCICLLFAYGAVAEEEDNGEKRENGTIESVLAQAKLKMGHANDDNGYLYHLVEMVLDEMNEMRSDLEKLKLSIGSEGIGFTATLGAHITITPNSNIPFTRYINSYGDGFIIKYGKFICQKDGLYQFSASVCIFATDVWVFIYKNDKHVGYLYKDAGNYHGSASGSIVVHMKRGDTLYLQPNKGGHIADLVTIISGFRISNLLTALRVK